MLIASFEACFVSTFFFLVFIVGHHREWRERERERESHVLKKSKRWSLYIQIVYYFFSCKIVR